MTMDDVNFRVRERAARFVMGEGPVAYNLDGNTMRLIEQFTSFLSTGEWLERAPITREEAEARGFADTFAAGQAGVRIVEPITRDEIGRRGLAESAEATAAAVINMLGWPSPNDPLGQNGTHKLVPVQALERLRRVFLAMEDRATADEIRGYLGESPFGG